MDFSEATDLLRLLPDPGQRAAALAASAKILKAATEQKVEALVMSCPLCEYNLGRRQGDVRAKDDTVGEIPTFYFTQLLAVALGLPESDLGLKFNEKAAAELLRSKNYL